MRSGRHDFRGVSFRGALALVVAAVPMLATPAFSADVEITIGEVVITAAALSPQALMTEPEHRVTFVNRSGQMVHIQFLMPNVEQQKHHIFQVPDKIWAIFHQTGRHPFVVHFGDPRVPNLEGTIEVVRDPYGRPDPLVCSGITVQGACSER